MVFCIKKIRITGNGIPDKMILNPSPIWRYWKFQVSGFYCSWKRSPWSSSVLFIRPLRVAFSCRYQAEIPPSRKPWEQCSWYDIWHQCNSLPVMNSRAPRWHGLSYPAQGAVWNLSEYHNIDEVIRIHIPILHANAWASPWQLWSSRWRCAMMPCSLFCLPL